MAVEGKRLIAAGGSKTLSSVTADEVGIEHDLAVMGTNDFVLAYSWTNFSDGFSINYGHSVERFDGNLANRTILSSANYIVDDGGIFDVALASTLGGGVVFGEIDDYYIFDSGDNSDVFAQFIDSTGAVDGVAPSRHTTLFDDPLNPHVEVDVVGLSDGSRVVMYVYVDQPNGGGPVTEAAIYDASGNSVTTVSISGQGEAIASLSSGGFVAISYVSGDEVATFFDEAGNAGPSVVIFPGFFSTKGAVGLDDGTWALAYTDGTDVRLSIYDGSGQLLSDTFVGVGAGMPAIATANGVIALAWGTDDDNIAARLMSTDGSPLGDVQMIETAAGWQDDPSVAMVGNAAVVSWWDDVTQSIRGQLLTVMRQLTGDDTREVIDGNGGRDYIDARGGNDIVRGLGGNDILLGGTGQDTIDGGTGADAMTGGAENDLYLVDHTQDTIVEQSGGGTADIVRTSVSFTLAADDHIEKMETTNASGTANLNLTGNALLGQTITGNAGTNTLNGGTGALKDTLIGLGGNDIYIINSSNDDIVEAAGRGTGDRAKASVTFALASGDNIEFLETTNAALTTALNLTGNEIAQTITGNAGANTLSGLAGNDTILGNGGNDKLLGGLGNDRMTGGSGNDIFVFNTALNASSNKDTIVDFNVAQDTIQIENAIFTGVTGSGTLSAAQFFRGAAAHDANDRIIYNASTGALIYDSNGSAAGGAIQFASLANGLAITNADFVII